MHNSDLLNSNVQLQLNGSLKTRSIFIQKALKHLRKQEIKNTESHLVIDKNS